MSDSFAREALLEQYEDALFRAAMVELEIERAERILSGLEQEDGEHELSDGIAAAAQAKPKMYQLIERKTRAAHLKRLVTHTLPKVGIAAACIVMIASVGLVTVFATSKTVRAKVFQFMVHVQAQYTEVSLQEDESQAFDVPSDWNGDYFPTYIPEGFELAEVEGYPDWWAKVIYNDSVGNLLYFSENGAGMSTQINTEGVEIEYIDIQGKTGQLSQQDGRVSIVWAADNRYFLLHYDGAKEDALHIANSVRRIN